MKYVNQPIVKKDAYALLSGKPVYCDDRALKDCLIIKLLRSPHAHAKIKSIDTTLAEKVPGIEAVYLTTRIMSICISAMTKLLTGDVDQ